MGGGLVKSRRNGSSTPTSEMKVREKWSSAITMKREDQNGEGERKKKKPSKNKNQARCPSGIAEGMHPASKTSKLRRNGITTGRGGHQGKEELVEKKG